MQAPGRQRGHRHEDLRSELAADFVQQPPVQGPLRQRRVEIDLHAANARQRRGAGDRRGQSAHLFVGQIRELGRRRVDTRHRKQRGRRSDEQSVPARRESDGSGLQVHALREERHPRSGRQIAKIGRTFPRPQHQRRQRRPGSRGTRRC